MTPVLAVAAICAAVYGLVHAGRGEGRESWGGSVVKTASTGLLALGFGLGGAPGLLVLGLALGAFGDLALSRPGRGWFLAGMAGFALGHLAYAGWMAGQGMAGGLSAGEAVVLVALAGLLVSTRLWLLPFAGALRLPVAAYVGVIGVMAAAAVLLPSGTALAWVKAGAALFVLSDLLLAIRLFRVSAPGLQAGLGRALWPAYWLGQALILWGGAGMPKLL